MRNLDCQVVKESCFTLQIYILILNSGCQLCCYDHVIAMWSYPHTIQTTGYSLTFPVCVYLFRVSHIYACVC